MFSNETSKDFRTSLHNKDRVLTPAPTSAYMGVSQTTLSLFLLLSHLTVRIMLKIWIWERNGIRHRLSSFRHSNAPEYDIRPRRTFHTPKSKYHVEPPASAQLNGLTNEQIDDTVSKIFQKRNIVADHSLREGIAWSTLSLILILPCSETWDPVTCQLVTHMSPAHAASSCSSYFTTWHLFHSPY